jgi:hypothetical protein
MKKQDALDVLSSLTPDQQIFWMIQLDAALTVSARAAYREDVGRE